MTRVTATSPPLLPDQYEAAAKTHGGADGFATLLAQVSVESNFKSNAENHETGAAGPFQFARNTWLDLVRRHGAELGVKADLLSEIKRDTGGKPAVADPKARQALLDLRHDLDLSAKMAQAYLDENRASLGRQLGRPPSDAEVQMSFLLGASGAAKLIAAAGATPGKPVDEVLPKAVAANRTLFADQDGGALSAGAAVARLTQRFGRDRTRFAAYLKAAPQPAAPAVGPAAKDVTA